MKKIKPVLSIGLMLAGFCIVYSPKSIAASNVYETKGVLRNQDTQNFTLQKYKDKTLLVVVGYSSCPQLCPMITAQLKDLERWLENHQISTDRVQILFLTIDPKDTPKNLLEYAKKHKLNLKRWTLAQAKTDVKSKVTGALGLSFNKENPSSLSHLRHSLSLVVVNTKGEISKTYPSALDIEIEKVGMELISDK